jgi:adenosylhomocysteine nucleosidase
MKLLFVAAAPMEYNGMMKMAEAQEALGGAVRWSRYGQIGGHPVLLIANGVGWKRAAAAVDAASASFHPDALVSTGFCGALDPDLGIGAVVVGSCVRGAGSFALHEASSFACQPASSSLPHAQGIVFSTDHVVQTAAEKSVLRSQGASVVEMEAAAVAARAQSLGLPFYCVRTVTDLAGEDMANDFNAALHEDGHLDTMRIFRHSLSQPAVRLPELIRLRGNCKRAAQTLGEFFADCQF